jgi:hypothetical protein
MHRLTSATLAVMLVSLPACSAKKKNAEDPSTKNADVSGDGTAKGDEADAGAGESADAGEAKKDECIGFDIANMADLLSKSACEETKKPDSFEPVDLKGKLDVVASSVPTKVAPGAKAELLVTFTNKTKSDLTLHFRIDPLPRFETETYDKKGKRADMPAGDPPPPPKGVSMPEPSEPKSARMTIAANGTARMHVPWEAVKMKWAPDKVRGSIAEKGYPRVPAGSLRNGKYSVKIVTPLVGVFEGVDHEVSAPKVEIEVGR